MFQPLLNYVAATFICLVLLRAVHSFYCERLSNRVFFSVLVLRVGCGIPDHYFSFYLVDIFEAISFTDLLFSFLFNVRFYLIFNVATIVFWKVSFTCIIPP